MSNNWRNICCPSLEQSGCILFGTHECAWSPQGEGELHWMSAQLENCPVRSSSAVKWTVCVWYWVCELRLNDGTVTETWNRLFNSQGRLLKWKIKNKNLWVERDSLSRPYRVCLHSDQWVERAAASNYKLCVSTSAHHDTLALSWFWCRDGIRGRVLDGCEGAVDSGGLLRRSVGGNSLPSLLLTQ